MKILIIEDEKLLADSIRTMLESKGFAVDVCYDGESGADYAELGVYDLLILDVMMPGMDGYQVARHVRAQRCSTPILMLTARSGLEDRIEGLDRGADDDLPKPFVMGELLARVRAMLRRREEFTPDILRCGALNLNMRSCELSCGGVTITLPKLEYKMMELLMLNRGIYLSTEDILTKVWGYNTDAELGIVWVYISYLRKKLAALDCGVEIKAKRNIGYTLEAVK